MSPDLRIRRRGRTPTEAAGRRHSSQHDYDVYVVRMRRVWHPPTDVYETRDDIVIKMSVPGIRRNQVTVACEGETVTICGWRGGPDPATVVTYHQMEIRNGYFERQVVLHRPFDPADARARYEDGFLFVHVPKAEKLIRQVLTIRLEL